MKTDPNSHATSDKSKSQGSSNEVTKKTGVATQLNELFEDELKDIYWAEKALVKALPKMIRNTTSSQLTDALTSHLKETEYHTKRIEEIFALIKMKPEAKKCEAITGLIKEAENIMKSTAKGAVRDAGIISAAQKIEHYEIATYGTLSSFAKTLGNSGVVSLLGKTLNEEKNADSGLTSIAESLVNIQAI